jgi:ABC-2 type transport system permease protein
MSTTTPPRTRSPELPVLGREMRATMRGRRLIIRLAVAGLLPVALCIFILLILRSPGASADMLAFQPIIGRAVFLAMVGAEFLLILFVAPGLTAGAFAAEGEAQTLESLFLTPLSSANLTLGKLLCAISTLALLLLCGIPIAGVAALYGGISPADLWWTQGVLAGTLLFTASLGLYCSTLARRTMFATLIAYIITLVLHLSPFVLLVVMAVTGGGPSPENPAYLTVLLLMGAGFAAGIATPFTHGIAPWVRGRLVRGQQRRRWILFTIWGIVFLAIMAPLTMGILYVLNDFDTHFPYLFAGSPVIALGFYGASMYYPMTDPSMPIFLRYFVPVTTGMLPLGALLLFWATVQRVNVMRRPE